MPKLFPSFDLSGAPTKADKVFRGLCAADGLRLGLERNICLKIMCFAGWLVTTIVSCGAVAYYVPGRLALEKEKVSLTVSVNLINSILTLIFAWCWKLSFMLNNDSFDYVLQVSGRRLRDIFPLLLCLCPYLILNFVAISQFADRSLQLGRIVFVLYDFSRMNFLMLYNDALIKILKIQIELKVSIATPMTATSRDEISSRKWLIRDLITKVNDLFALPLIMFYLHFLTMVVCFFCDFFGQSSELNELSVIMASVLCDIFQALSLVNKCSTVAAHNAELEGYVFKQTLSKDGDELVDADFLAVFRLREECDFLRVASFTIDIRSFLKYLTFCVTLVAIVLQFDYKVVRYVKTLADSE